MAIVLESQGISADRDLKTPAATTQKQPIITPTPATAPLAPVGFNLKMSPGKELLTADKIETPPERAVRQLEESYQKLKASVDLKKFRPSEIENYIRLAERRSNVAFSETDRDRLRQMAKSSNPELHRLAALELRIGIPEKVEKEALASLARVMLYRGHMETLQKFLMDPEKDENLKGFIRTFILMHRLERIWDRFRSARERMLAILTLRGIFPLVFPAPPPPPPQQQEQVPV